MTFPSLTRQVKTVCLTALTVCTLFTNIHTLAYETDTSSEYTQSETVEEAQPTAETYEQPTYTEAYEEPSVTDYSTPEADYSSTENSPNTRPRHTSIPKRIEPTTSQTAPLQETATEETSTTPEVSTVATASKNDERSPWAWENASLIVKIGYIILGLIGFALVLSIYFAPALIAIFRGHAYKWVILGINLPLILIGLFSAGVGGIITWIGLMVWANWPKEKNLLDPVVNLTGMTDRNVGNTAGIAVPIIIEL